jgi:hypothetical protein
MCYLINRTKVNKRLSLKAPMNSILLIDAFTRKSRRRNQYISLDLCNMIDKYLFEAYVKVLELDGDLPSQAVDYRKHGPTIVKNIIFTINCYKGVGTVYLRFGRLTFMNMSEILKNCNKVKYFHFEYNFLFGYDTVPECYGYERFSEEAGRYLTANKYSRIYYSIYISSIRRKCATIRYRNRFAAFKTFERVMAHRKKAEMLGWEGHY